MGKKRITTYTFDASEKTITFSGALDIEGFTLITNVVDNTVIYQFNDSNLGGTFSTNTLTLAYDTSSMSDTDELMILYDDGVETIEISNQIDQPLTDTQLRATAVPVSGTFYQETQPISGTVTANLGATDNAVLDSIASNTTALALETGGNLAAIKTNTDDIEALLTTIESNQLPDGHNVTIDNVSITVDTGLTQPLTDTELRATPVPVDLGVNNDVTVTSGNITETNSGDIKTAVETVATAVHQNSSQATESDYGVAIYGKIQEYDAHTVDDEDDYDTLSLTGYHEVRTRDQRAVDLANCNDYTDYTALSNDTTGIANESNHVFGSGAITFNKVNGADNTVYGGVSKALANLNVQEIFEAGGFVGLSCYLSSLVNVVNVFLRIGTDASNYNCWTWEASSLAVGTWMNLRKAAANCAYAKSAGTGWNTTDLRYVAFGVEFTTESNTLSGIKFDHVHMVGGRITASDTETSITSTVNTPNINVNKVGGNIVDVNNGTVSTGTQRVTIASDSTGQVKLAAGTEAIGKLGANSGVDIGDVTINNSTGASAVNIQDGGNSITVDGSITANAGTNLNTSALALETGGNLASIKTNTDKIPAQGQALAAASLPVVLPADQITTLTPPAAITGFATSAKQDTIIGHIDGIEGSIDGIETLLGTIDTDTSNISTKIDTVAGAVAGTEMQVDVLTMPTTTVQGTVTANLSATDNAVLDDIAANQTDASQKTQIVDGSGNVIGATSNALDVNIKSGASSGVQYTEGDTDASITGTAMMMEAGSDTLEPVQGSLADGLLVNLGTNNDVVVSDGGGSITVDGTVTANLSATDNAVLDNIDTNTAAIDGHVDGIEGLLTTIDSDTSSLAGTVAGTEIQVDVVGALPEGTNIVGRIGHDITGIGHGVKTVTTAGTDVALAASTPCKKVDIQAQTDNTGVIAVGGSGVDATIATGTGILLEAGDTYSLEIDNLADIYIDSTVNGEGVRFIYYT